MSGNGEGSEAAGRGRGLETRDADEFAAVLKQSFKPSSERAATEVENAVTTLVEQALADTSLVKDDVLDTIEEMIARLDEKLTSQVNAILHARSSSRSKAPGAGLHYLVFNSETDANLKIRVMNVSKKELYQEPAAVPGARWDQSPLFKQIYEHEFGQLGGEPYGCLIGDYYFGHLPTDVQLLRDLSKIAAAAHAPFFAGADPTLMGMDAWTELSNPRDIGKIFDTPEYAAWKGLRDPVDSRYMGLCMPRVLSRLPYGAKSEPVEEFAFEEETDGHKRREIRLDERRLCDGGERQPRVQGIWLDDADPRGAVGRRGDQPPHPYLPDRRRRRRSQMPDGDRHQRPARGRAC